MKILVIWGESLAKPGGGTVHCLGLVQGLQRDGHEVTVIAPAYSDLPETNPGKAYQFLRLGRRSFLRFAVFQLLSVLLLPFWLLRYRPRAVYVRTCFLQGLQAILTRLTGVPLVGEVDSIVDEEIHMRAGSRFCATGVHAMDVVNFFLTHGQVCVTRGLRAEVLKRGGRAKTTVAIPNGASVEVMKPQDPSDNRRRMDLSETAFLVGFAGAFAVWQGLDSLVEAAELLHKRQRNDIHFALMGGGDLKEWLQQEVARRNLSEHFRLYPQAEQKEVASFLSACDAVAIPIHDPRKLRYGLSPLKFWDAVSMGLPPLIPRQADLGDVLADLGIGAEYDHVGPEALADAIETLAHRPRRTLEQRMHTHQIVREKYSWDAVARHVAAFLETLITGNKRADA